ncbi:MAG TPA: NADP-dependent oxidoreductase [Sphingopyxis sp.]|nr:NADP-dependent oxidoreductase [Sphingopyxis sp.]
MNRQCILVSRPEGVAQAENFEIIEAPEQALAEGEIRVRNAYLSVEPAMRGWIADKGNYAEPVAIGSVMRAIAAGIVTESKSDAFAAGDAVTGWFGWQEEAVAPASAVLRKVEETDLPLSLSLGILGINGVTAHLALTRVGEPKPGDTLLVSTAAGAVGSAVGQIGKLLGCRTIGVAGGAEKAKLCRTRFGYDEALDYKDPGFAAMLAETCLDGIDVYFDNTAGAISDAVLPHLAINARVVVCGTASIAQWDPWPQGARVERHLLVKRARMQGFVIFDHMDRWDASVAELARWIRSGDLVYEEDVLDGLGACPDALAGLYRGENRGKRVIRL